MNDFFADLHIHSRFSRATSSKLSFGLLAAWAQVKGISVLGTGDFTHPAWRGEMAELLEFEEKSGLYRLKKDVSPELAVAGLSTPEGVKSGDVPRPRFMLQGEISSIYKRGGKVRKVHNLVYLPTLEATEKLCKKLEAIGNLKSDGRPILGLDSERLLELVLETDDRAFLIPAHIWTPWFSLFGSKSGFDAIEDCFGSLTKHIFALETGLSSDPAMNRCVSALDGFRLVSNSDAHSGENLGRELNRFSGEVSYDGMLTALRSPEKAKETLFRGTLEFYPEEGKYHADGHRKCNVCLTPEETRELKGICPVCHTPLTVGVHYRVMELADRHEPVYADGTTFSSVVPLPEVLGELLGVGPKSRKVGEMYARVLNRFGSEAAVLQSVPEVELSSFFPPLAEAIGRMRRGEVHIQTGYDGEYGVIRMFTDAERAEIQRGVGITVKEGKKAKVKGLSLLDEPLLESEVEAPVVKRKRVKPTRFSEDVQESMTKGEEGGAATTASLPAEADSAPLTEPSESVIPEISGHDAPVHLNREQEEAMKAGPGPVLVLAGPGTGKTKTLVSRVEYLVNEGINPRSILAVTFTRKAASEMDARLKLTLGENSRLPRTDTLHAIALEIWLKTHGETPVLLSEESAFRVFSEANPEGAATALKEAWHILGLAREKLEDVLPEYAEMARNYVAHKSAWNLADYTDLLEFWLEQVTGRAFKHTWEHILVDEVQDLSALQLSLVSSLLPPSGEGFFGIGDPNQSIYGFRGASGNCSGFFLHRWSHLQVIALKQNYRSKKELLEASASLFEQEQRPMLVPAVEGAGYIHLFKAPSEGAESRWVADKVAMLLGARNVSMSEGEHLHDMPLPKDGYAPGDIAILVRTHTLGRVFRNALSRVGLPVSEPDADVFWADPRVGVVLRAAGRMLGIDLAVEEDSPDTPVCPDKVLSKGPLGMAAYLSTVPPFDAHFWHSRPFRELVKAYDENKGWSGLLTWIHLQTELELVRQKSEKVQILSMHAAKGLEFPIVFIPCLEDGIIPYAGAVLTGRADKKALSDINEERRLLYVAMTRAKDALFLSLAAKRILFGAEIRLGPSRYLQSIPKELTTLSTLVAKNHLTEKQLNLL